jgi:hypothetical protein
MATVEGTVQTGTATPLAPPAPVTLPTDVERAGIGTLGEELYQQVLPLHGPDPDLLAYDLVGAWIRPTQTIYDLVGDSDAGPGWVRLFDPDLLQGDELYWLAQARGVRLRQRGGTEPLEEWEAYARAAIREQAAQHRGTVDAQVAAIAATLTGSRWVSYVERVGSDAYAIAVRTRTAETPSPALTLAAMLDYEYGAKPAGLTLDYQTVSGQTYGAIAGIYATYGAMSAAVSTYRALAEAKP